MSRLDALHTSQAIVAEHAAGKDRRAIEAALLRDALEKDREAERRKHEARAVFIKEVYDVNKRNLVEKQRLLRANLEREQYEQQRNDDIRRYDLERMQLEAKLKKDQVDQVSWNNRALAEEVKLRNLEKVLEERRKVVNDVQLPDAHVFNGVDHYIKVRGSHPLKTNAYRQGKQEFERNEEEFKRDMEAFYNHDMKRMVEPSHQA